MEQIARDSRRTFHLHAMEPGEGLPPAFDGAPYAALLWSTSLPPDPQRQRIATALIASGCRFIACGGVEPEAWEDAADEAYLAQERPEPVPQDRFVTTSSHRGDSPDTVVFFLAQATRDRFTRYLVLLVGPDEAVEESLIAAVREEAGAWG